MGDPVPPGTGSGAATIRKSPRRKSAAVLSNEIP